MVRRTVCVQSAASVSVRNNSLVIETRDGGGMVPLEDIWVVVLETHQAKVTTAALSSIVTAGIGVMLCGTDHMPNGLLLPLGAHSRHAAIVEDQLSISKPLRKRLWQRIVQGKILNQARTLEILGLDASGIVALSKEVRSGDPTNRESVAASVYFRSLLPSGSRRTGPYAAALDYGYAILRAGIGRAAVGGGWLVSRGLHHRNELNAFNLVDDLIEPFRPVVDLLVIREGLEGELTPRRKAALATVFEILVNTPQGRMPVQGAIEIMLDTLKAAVREGDPMRLQLPEVIPLVRAQME